MLAGCSIPFREQPDLVFDALRLAVAAARHSNLALVEPRREVQREPLDSDFFWRHSLEEVQSRVLGHDHTAPGSDFDLSRFAKGETQTWRRHNSWLTVVLAE